MLHYIRCLHAYATGKLRSNKDLQKGFWVMITFVVIIWCFSAYNASMSYSYYLSQAGTLPMANIMALAVTTLIAVIIVSLGTSVVDTMQDYLAERDMHNRNGSMFATLLILWIVLQGWDIYVNFKGVQGVSLATTRTYSPDNSLSVKSAYDKDIESAKKSLLGVYGQYYWCAKHGTRHASHNPSLTGNDFLQGMSAPADVCRHEKFWFGYGGSSGRTLASHNKAKTSIAKWEKTIGDKMKLQTTSVSNAQAEYAADLSRFKGELSDKEGTHNHMIIISYMVILLCTIFNCQYMNKVSDVIKANYGKGSRAKKSPTNPRPGPQGGGGGGGGPRRTTGNPNPQPKVNTTNRPSNPPTRPVAPPKQPVRASGSDNVVSMQRRPTTPRNQQVDVAAMMAEFGNQISSLREQLKTDLLNEIRSEVVKKTSPPNNGGKKYKTTKTTESSSSRPSAEELKKMLQEYRKNNPGHNANQAAAHFNGKMSRATVYKYWSDAA